MLHIVTEAWMCYIMYRKGVTISTRYWMMGGHGKTPDRFPVPLTVNITIERFIEIGYN